MATAIEKLRIACLQRGASGIHGIGRSFRIMDDDGSRSLDRDELMKGLYDYGLKFTKAEVTQMLIDIDRDHSGRISFNEFLQALRPPMSEARLEIIDKAFNKMDKTGDGVVTVVDLMDTYDVSRHPKFISGERTKEQIIKKYLDVFQRGDTDEEVTKDDFVNYYSGLSASIDSDEYFVSMMKNSWDLWD